MSEFIRQSWVFPVVQSVHLIGIALLIGTVSALDFHLLGIGQRRVAPGELAAALAPWTSAGLFTVLTTGPILFGADLPRYLANPAFLVKMSALAVALTLHFTMQRITLREGSASQPSRQKLAAMLSLVVWTAVILAGRAIADFDIRPV